MGDADALVAYFCREGQWRHVQSVVEDVSGKRGWEPRLVFWKCFGLGREGNVNAAIRELEEVRRKRDFELASVEALLWLHGSVKLRDAGAVSELERARSGLEESSSDAGLLLAGELLCYLRECARAARLVDRVLSKNPLNIRANVLRGWVEALSDGCGAGAGKQALGLFEQALNADRSGRKDLNALMGKAFVLGQQGKQAEAIECLDQAIVGFAWFLPAITEKAKALVAVGRWDMALETAERVLAQDANDVGALRVVATYRVAHACAPGEALAATQALSDALDRFEPENPALWLAASRPLARLAQRSEELLRKTLRLVERAKRKAPESAECATEYAYQLALMSKTDAAFAAYEHAATLDESNGGALFGQIYCLVQRGELDEASQQLEFLGVLQETIGRSAQVAFLEAKLLWLRDRDRRGSLKLLNETVHLHVKAIQAVPAQPSTNAPYEHLVRFNPDFMLEIAKEYLQHCGSEPIEQSEQPPQQLSNGIKLLDKVIKFVPCMLTAQIALARARFVAKQEDLCAKTVQTILALDPHFADAHLLMAQVQLSQDDFAGARASLEHAMAHDFSVRDNATYVLVKARVLQATGDLAEAQALLEQALAHADEKHKQQQQDKPQDKPAAAAARQQLDSKGGRARAAALEEQGAGSSSHGGMAPQVRASILVDLAQVHMQLKQVDKARTIIHAARREYRGTPEEVRLIIAESEIALRRNDVKGALRLLGEVPSDSPAFTKAQLAKANIYLTYQNNAEAFVRCYAELAEQSPSNAHAHLLLGEAYMRINMPDEAIEAFKEALKRNPKDAQLAARIGKVLVATHDYQRAIEYYKSAVRSSDSGLGGRQALRYDLAELYFYMGKLPRAEKELQSALGDAPDSAAAEDEDGAPARPASKARASASAEPEQKGGELDLGAQVKALKLLARVYEEMGETARVADALNQARDAQGRALSAARSSASSSAEAVQQARIEMAAVCILLAQHLERQAKAKGPAVPSKPAGEPAGKAAAAAAAAAAMDKDGDEDEGKRAGEAAAAAPQPIVMSAEESQACELYNEALRHDGGNVPAMLALARLLMRCGDHERCHALCVTILRVDEHNEEASMMLADLLFRRSEFKVAVYHYQQLLERNPVNLVALARLVTLLHRAGELEQAAHWFELAEHKSPRVVHNPGFCYAKGLFHRLSSDVNAAVAQFNKARRDVVWGERALTQMIELYLNFDAGYLWEDADKADSEPAGAAQGSQASRLEAVRTAHKLLEELPPSHPTTLLRCYATMASRVKADVEKAFQQLVEIVQERPDDVPSLLALSTALMMMKQTQKARSQLKRISRMEYDQAQADAFERCWLLLVDIFIEGGKYDLAQGLCKRCLQHNRSCAKAWEYMGLIMEKESAFADAAEHYEQAWRLQKMASASTGYKLAFNYLRAKKNVEAIDVSSKVLKQFPDYPKIQKDILDKARMAIRA